MNPSDLASLHLLLADVATDRNIRWQLAVRAPSWAFAASSVQLGHVVCRNEQVAVFSGPWLGLRVLGKVADGWRFARLFPRRRAVPTRPGRVGLAHRFATPEPPARRRGNG